MFDEPRAFKNCNDATNGVKRLGIRAIAFIMRFSWRILLVLSVLTLRAAPAMPAFAQLQLHPSGSIPVGPVVREQVPGSAQVQGRPTLRRPLSTAPKTAAQKPVAHLSMSLDLSSLAEQDLMQNGYQGLMHISKQGDGFVLAALSLPGADISNPDKSCTVKLHLAQSLPLQSMTNQDGVASYTVGFPACPFSFDVLHRSVLVHKMSKACVFSQVDCATHPEGLWGPNAATLGPIQAAANDRARGVAERRMRTLFVMLMHATRGQVARNQLASEQARFTTHRVMVCRTYAQDAVEDFCALRLTEARAMALDAALVRAHEPHERAKMKHQRKNR